MSTSYTNTRRARATTLILVAFAIAGAAGVYASRKRRPPKTFDDTAVASHGLAVAPSVLRFAWKKGARYVYEVQWEAASTVASPAVAGGAIRGEARFKAELGLSTLGEEEGRFLFAARLANVTEHRLRVMDAEVYPNDDAAHAAFDGRQAFLRVGADGALEAIHFGKADPPAFTHVMQTLLEQMQVTLPGDARTSWSASVATTIGPSIVQYAVSDTSPFALSRVRQRYDAFLALPGDACRACDQSLVSHASITIDPVGIVGAIDETEQLVVKRSVDADGAALAESTRFRATFLRTESFDADAALPLDLASFDTRAPGQVVASASAEEKMLANRVGSMTRDAMLEGVRSYDRSRTLVDRAFVARAAGLLLQHPELCQDLVAVFEDRALGEGGRALTLDLLASAASAPAQAAMRSALSSPAATRDKGAFPIFLQRFAVLPHPEPESVQLVRRAYASAGGDTAIRNASAYTLGSFARALSHGGDRDTASALDSELRRALAAAKSPSDKITALTALGNAAQASDVDAIRAFASDDDPSVRASAANALRDEPPDDAHPALLALVHDADANVQGSALRALDAQPVSAGDVHALAAAVDSGAIAAGNEGALVTFFAKHTENAPDDARKALLALLAQAERSEDRRLAARLKVLLEATGGWTAGP